MSLLPGGDGRVGQLLKELEVRPDKRRGQNFLMDMGVLVRQINAARLTPGDTVLEVGAGLGVLTWELAFKARKVIAYESDRRLAAYLERGLPENVELHVADALEEDWPPFDKMVSNVPYSISSPLLFKLIASDFAAAVLMFQREFVERLVAGPGTKDYGRLTVAVARLARVELLEVVPSTAFHPRPRVDSAMVSIVSAKAFPIKDPALFDEVLRVVFSQRRKMLHNSLEGARGRLAPGVGIDEWRAFVRDLEHAGARPEELAPHELGRLADQVYDMRV